MTRPASMPSKTERLHARASSLWMIACPEKKALVLKEQGSDQILPRGSSRIALASRFRP